MENEKKTITITAEVIDYEDDGYWDDRLGYVTVRTYTVRVHDPSNKHAKEPWMVTDYYEPVR